MKIVKGEAALLCNRAHGLHKLNIRPLFGTRSLQSFQQLKGESAPLRLRWQIQGNHKHSTTRASERFGIRIPGGPFQKVKRFLFYVTRNAPVKLFCANVSRGM